MSDRRKASVVLSGFLLWAPGAQALVGTSEKECGIMSVSSPWRMGRRLGSLPGLSPP